MRTRDAGLRNQHERAGDDRAKGVRAGGMQNPGIPGLALLLSLARAAAAAQAQPAASIASNLVTVTTPAGIPLTDEDFGSFAGSRVGATPTDFVPLVDPVGGHGPIVPVPGPGSLALPAGGLATLAWLRRRS